MSEGRRVVLVPIAEYRTLLEQNVLAPKTGKYNPLSAKQKRKVEEQMEAACIVMLNMSTVDQQPVDVQRKMAETMH